MSDALVQPIPTKNARRWVQIGIAPAAGPTPGLYRRIADLTAAMVEAGLVENHFFMHKSPGLRLRFQAKPRRRADVATAVHREVAQWSADGLVTGWQHGLYEPEEALFGGPVSMRFVHRTFSADSLVWLDHHSKGGAPSWLVALLLTRSLLDAFDIGPWEDSDVGHLIRRAGRKVCSPVEGTAEVLARLSRWWRDPDELLASLDETDTLAVTLFRARAHSEARQWRTEYFDTPNATMGPRQMLAYHSVFMWNRGRLSPFRQALLADSLALIP